MVVGAVAVAACSLATAGTASATVFNAAGGLTIPTVGNATPFPQTANVSGTTGLITDIDVGFSQLTHGNMQDIGAILVSPGGQEFAVFDGIDGLSVSNINVAFDDQASMLAPDGATLTTGTTYKPTAHFTDPWPTPPGTAYARPAPLGTDTLDGTFGGFSANGTWKLFVSDFVAANGGSIGLYSLSITTGTPDASLTPFTHGFAPRDPAEGPTPTHTFTTTNTGATPLHLDTPVIAGVDSGDFDITEDNCGSQTLAPAGICTVKVAFNPDTLGPKNDARLHVQVEDVGTLSSELSGTGSLLSSFDAPSFGYGARDVSSGPTASHAFHFFNDATDVDLHVSNVGLTGANPGDFGITSNSCSGAVIPGSSCQVEVAFDPTAAGAKAATLRVTSDAPTPSTDAQLTGQGTVPPPPGGGGGGGGGGASTATGQRAAALAKCKKKKGTARKKCKSKAAKLPV